MNFQSTKPGWASQNFWSLNEQMKSEFSVTFVREIDATELDQLRADLSRLRGRKPSYTSLITEAAARILLEFPVANRRLFKFGPFQRLIQFRTTDITVAIEKDLPGAEAVVLAHTIRNCDSLSITEITTELQNALVTENERWQYFKDRLNSVPPLIGRLLLKMADWFPATWVQQRGGACMVNSPAKYGIDLIVADMLWPLVFSFGEVKLRPFVVNGQVQARRTVPLTMIFDRRIMQGAIAARIFNRFCALLESGESLSRPQLMPPPRSASEPPQIDQTEPK